MKLVAFTGLKGSGKDTAADEVSRKVGLTKKPALTVQFAFADILKNIIHETFDLKNTEADEIKRMQIKPFNGLSLREVYQRMGEAIKSRFGQNVWADAALTRIEHFIKDLNPDIIMVTDLRYLNEEAALRKFCEDNGIELYIIKLINANLPENTDQHPSEVQIESINEDFLVKAHDVDELKLQIGDIYDTVLR